MTYYQPDYELIAEDMLENNYDHDEIVDYLVRRGLERYSAEDVLANVLAVQRRRHFWRGVMVVTGSLILLGVVTLMGNAIQRGDFPTLSFSTIPFVFGLSMIAYAIRRKS